MFKINETYIFIENLRTHHVSQLANGWLNFDSTVRGLRSDHRQMNAGIRTNRSADPTPFDSSLSRDTRKLTGISINHNLYISYICQRRNSSTISTHEDQQISLQEQFFTGHKGAELRLSVVQVISRVFLNDLYRFSVIFGWWKLISYVFPVISIRFLYLFSIDFMSEPPCMSSELNLRSKNCWKIIKMKLKKKPVIRIFRRFQNDV